VEFHDHHSPSSADFASRVFKKNFHVSGGKHPVSVSFCFAFSWKHSCGYDGKADETMRGGAKRNQKRSKHRSKEQKTAPWKIRVYDSSDDVEASEKNCQVTLSDGEDTRKKEDRAA